MYLKIPFNSVFFILIIIGKRLVRAIEYPVTFATCPGNYQRINNGCYYFANASTVDWKKANESCATEHNVTGAHTHLIAFESLAESISFSFWFRGNKYTNNFWTDMTINPSNPNKRVWSWSSHDYTAFGYLKDNFTNINNKNGYLRKNDSNYNYELNDDKGITPMNYICEAQLPCNETDNKCFNNGTCWINSGRVLCTCKDGFQGAYCEILVDNCESIPCLHGATCNNSVNNYTCTCTPFYHGRNCEIEIPNAFEDGRKTALSISVSFVGLILLILCLMDLPWHAIRRTFCPNDDEKLVKERQNNKKEKALEEYKKQEKLKESSKPTKEQLIASEEEMLRKFKLILAQNNVRKSGAITPRM